MFIDRQNNLWIGTSAYGAYRWNLFTNELVHFAPDNSDENSVNSPDIHHIFEDDQNNTWFGYHFLGASLMFTESWNYSFVKPFPELSDTAAENNVAQVIMDPQSIIWGVTNAGLVKNIGSEDQEVIEFEWDEMIATGPQPTGAILFPTSTNLFLSLGQNYSDIGIFNLDDQTFSTLGLSGPGEASVIAPISDGNNYYVGTFLAEKLIKINANNNEFETFMVPRLKIVPVMLSELFSLIILQSQTSM